MTNQQSHPATNLGRRLPCYATPSNGLHCYATTRSSAYVWVEPEDGLGPQLVQRPHLFVCVCVWGGGTMKTVCGQFPRFLDSV